jgi:LTXXQ motif family protein
MDAKADPPAMDDASPCAEGRALFAAKLAYLEAKISPEPSQEEAWRVSRTQMRTSAGEVDRTCVEDPPRPLSVYAGERLKRMERHAAAMQAMFGAMANAYVAIGPNLTAAQRDILSRNIVPSPPFAARFLSGKGPRAGDLARNRGQSEPGSHGSAQPQGASSF